MSKRAIAVVLLAAVLMAGCVRQPVTEPAAERGESAIAQAYRERAEGVQVQGAGVVTRLLADDSDGGRHQRFILELPDGQTLLMAHNIDVAPRVDALSVGDAVEFNGEYEYNDQGGVVHWTHHDPQGRHPGGWLKVGGQTYQ